jgi:hypothetical protein
MIRKNHPEEREKPCCHGVNTKVRLERAKTQTDLYGEENCNGNAWDIHAEFCDGDTVSIRDSHVEVYRLGGCLVVLE